MIPLFKTDAYKLFHRSMYPKNTIRVVSNWTPRSSSHYKGVNDEYVIVFGIQRMVKKMMKMFEEEFFSLDKDTVLLQYGRQIRNFTGDPSYGIEHIAYLHDLGYLPLCIKALPEGVKCPIGVPCMTIYNTDPKCFWLTNYLETWMSAELWGMMTSATIANEYREIFEEWCVKTGGPEEFVQWQGHDFSMRGMYGTEAATMSGLGHLTSFSGTDTIPAFIDAQWSYNAFPNNFEQGLFTASSVPASEHSVQCAHYTGEGELEYLDHMLEMFPTGIVSIVCDGFDFWHFITETLPKRKEQILARDGKVVIRPDSGDPVQIICGQNKEDWTRDIQDIPKQKGAIEVLWEIFGGHENEKGYRELDPHIGLIYGDSITLDRCRSICERLAENSFASTNVVLGIGSYTYQFNTRDTFGWAIKATYVEFQDCPTCEVVGKPIFKDPKTKGNVNKKSAKGLVRVIFDEEGNYILEDEQDWHGESQGALREVFRDGVLYVDDTLDYIRSRVKGL